MTLQARLSCSVPKMALSAFKWLSYSLGLLVMPAALAPMTLTWIENRQARDLQALAPYVSPVSVLP